MPPITTFETMNFTDTSPALQSKLPHVGTTVFTVMSALAQQHGAVNLGQGFPDFDCDPQLLTHVTDAMLAGHNQYPPMAGVLALRQAVADKIERLYGHRYDSASEVSITAGATQGLLTAFLAFVHPGDEVIVLDPCYDSYVPGIELAGGVVVRVPLRPGSFEPDLGAIAAAITPKTRALVINSPHNPSGTIWQAVHLQGLAQLLHGTSVVLISDEVYEHMVYAPNMHHSVSSFAPLAERALVVSSFGKTFHVTGWKVGTVVAPKPLMDEWRKVHQFNVFTVNTPMQHALAKYLQDPAPYANLPAFYQAKRDRFRAGLSNSAFGLLPCTGTYFQCVRYEDLKVSERHLSEAAFCEWLTEVMGVAAIPLSAFYGDGRNQGMVRFCFAKQDATLDAALARLATL
jgi:methionine transaminase